MRRKNIALIICGVVATAGLSLGVASTAGAAPAVGEASTASLALSASAKTKPASGKGGKAQPSAADLMTRYLVKHDCTVYPNYVKNAGGTGQPWTIKADHARSVIWRYNVNSKWALISDPARAGQQFPWWGFTERACLGSSVKQYYYPEGQPLPSRILSGRSHEADGWRPVVFDLPPAPVTGTRTLHSTATLRDPAHFVVANLFPGWPVEVTSHRSKDGRWVEVHVPNLDRWGYVEARDLS